MKKILEWELCKRYSNMKASFNFQGKEYYFKYYEHGQICLFNSKGNEPTDLPFGFGDPSYSVNDVKSLNEAKTICQKWYEENILKETPMNEKQTRVMKVVEDILDGETKLKWEPQTRDHWQNAYFEYYDRRNEVVAFKSQIMISYGKLFPSFQDYHPTSSIQEGKEIIQKWYDTFLLEEASK